MNSVFMFYFFLLLIAAAAVLFAFKVLSELLHYAAKELRKRKMTPEMVEKKKTDEMVALLRHLSQLTERDWQAMDTEAKFRAWCDDNGYPRNLLERNHQSKVR